MFQLDFQWVPCVIYGHAETVDLAAMVLSGAYVLCMCISIRFSYRVLLRICGRILGSREWYDDNIRRLLSVLCSDLVWH